MPISSRLRLAFLMTLAVYPVVTILLYLVFPLTAGWAIWQRTIILVPLIASTIVFFIAPFINRRFGGFIVGNKHARA